MIAIPSVAARIKDSSVEVGCPRGFGFGSAHGPKEEGRESTHLIELFVLIRFREYFLGSLSFQLFSTVMGGTLAVRIYLSDIRYLNVLEFD